MSLLQPPPFDPTSLFTNFGISDSAVKKELQLFQIFNTPEAKQQRQEDRDARTKQIAQESGQILTDLRAQCVFEKELVASGEIILINQKFANCDCKDDACILAAVPASGAAMQTLIDEQNQINEDNQFDQYKPSSSLPPMPPSQEKIDQELILKYRSLVRVWALHIFIDATVLPGPPVPPYEILPVPPLIVPTILTPAFTNSTAQDIYSNIKSYNAQHSNFQKGVIDAYKKYITPEEKAKRLAERLAQIPELEAQIAALEAALAKAQQQFDQIVKVQNIGGDVILIGKTIIEPDPITDGFSYEQTQLDRISKYRDDVVTQTLILEGFSYLTVSASILLADVDTQVTKRIFPKTILVASLTQQRNLAQARLTSIELNAISSAEVDVIVVQLSTMNQTLTFLTSTLIPDQVNVSQFIEETYNEFATVARINNATTYKGYVTLSEQEDFVPQLQTALPSSETDFDTLLTQAQNLAIARNAPQSVLEILIAILNKELMAAQLIAAATAAGQSGGGTGTVIPNPQVTALTESITAITRLEHLNEISGVILDFNELSSELVALNSGLLHIDSYTHAVLDPIYASYNSGIARYEADVVIVDRNIPLLSVNEQAAIQSLLAKRIFDTHQLDQLIAAFASQNQQRITAAQQQTATISGQVDSLNTQLVVANALPDDTKKIHSYGVIRQVANIIDSDRNDINQIVSGQAEMLAELNLLLEEKKQQLVASGDIVIGQTTLSGQILSLEAAIQSGQVPDTGAFNVAVTNLVTELNNSISAQISDLQTLIASLQFQVDNPTVDPAFVPPKDPFDEVLNAARAIVHGFMDFAQKFTQVLYTWLFVAPPVVFGGVDIAIYPGLPLLDPDALEALAQNVANAMKSGASLTDPSQLPAAILKIIVSGLYQKCSVYLIGNILKGITTPLFLFLI